MRTNIAHFALSLLLLFSCEASQEEKKALALPSGKILHVKVLTTIDEQLQGLSGVLEHQLADNHGYFFFYKKSDVKQFWMPDTYFNLNIIFLDQDLKVIYVEENIPAHPGREGNIPRTRPVYARHILEIKSKSPLAKEIVVGTTLKWM